MPRVFSMLLAAILTIASAAQESDAFKRLESARRLRQQRSFPSAARAYEAVLPALRSNRDRGVLAHALLEYGQTSLATGDYSAALKAAVEAVRIFRELRDTASETQADNV